MTLKEAIESIEASGPLNEHSSFVGVRLGGITITMEMLASTKWGAVIENRDPKFREAIEELSDVLKENGPLYMDGDEIGKLQ